MVLHGVVECGLEHPGPMPARDLAVLVAWAAGCLVLSARFFRRED